MNNLTNWQQSSTPNALVESLLNNITLDGGAVNHRVFREEYNDLHTTVKKQSSLVVAGGAYKVSTVYGYSPQTTALISFTFTRASTAMRTNQNGLLESVAANVPRMDFDPVTGKFKGLLMERASTNLLLRSEEFDNVIWGKNNIIVTVTTNPNPFGTSRGYYLTEDTANSIHYMSQSVSGFVSGTTYSSSIYIKKADDAWCQFVFSNVAFGANVWTNFNFDTGTFGISGGTGTWTVKQLANGYWLITGTATAVATTTANMPSIAGTNNTNTAARLLSYTGTSRKYCEIAAIQVEAGQSTSYIPTAGSAVTRSADACSAVPGAWYNSTEGSLYADALCLNGGGSVSRILAFDNGTGNNRIQLLRNNANNAEFLVSDGGVLQTNNPLGVATPGQRLKLSGGYKLNDFAGCSNGAAAVTDVSGTIPSINYVSIGSQLGTISPLDGYARVLAYFPTRLSNFDLQQITL